MRAMVALASGVALFLTQLSTAQGAVAEFTGPGTTASELAALSSQTDNAGALLGLGQTFTFRFDTAFATEAPGVLTVSTLGNLPGISRAEIRIGSFNNNNPQFVVTNTIVGGGTRTINNLFNRGCNVFGGCDFIEITTVFSRRGSPGIEVDYVLVDGEVVEVTSPTPEPGTWALLILGFTVTAARIKAVRRDRRGSAGVQRTPNGPKLSGLQIA